MATARHWRNWWPPRSRAATSSGRRSRPAARAAPAAWPDGYREALEELVAAKIQGRDVIRPQEPAGGPGSSGSLADVLEASLAAAREGQDAGPPHGDRKRRAQRKATA